jgi:hypothetical protein
MRLPFPTHPLLTVSLACLAVIGCGDGTPSTTGVSGNPSYPATVNGTYQATTLTLTEASGDTDMLAEGVVISLVLTPAGATTGSMTVPAAYSESGEEEILSLIGTYAYNAKTGIVTLAHPADTFLRDVTWHAKETRLNGTFKGASYTLTATLESGT